MNSEEQKQLNDYSNGLNDCLKNILSAYIEIDIILNNTINSGKGIWDGNSAKEYLDSWNRSKQDIPVIIKSIEQEKEMFEYFFKKIQSKKNE